MTSPNAFIQTCIGAAMLLLPALVLAACGDGTLAPFDASPDAVVGSADASSAASAAASESPIVARIRAGTAAYHARAAALDAGFLPVSPCVAVPGVGGMGFHYLDPGRIGDANVDPSRPELLLYEPQADGRLRLVGVEFLLIADVWDAQHATKPTLLGQPFDEHRGPDTHGLPFDHYEFHVWVWRHNPSGLTAPFNPRVSCDAA